MKDRLAALRNPKAHLHLPDIDLKTVEESFLLWDPLRYLDVCPSLRRRDGDGARQREGRRRGARTRVAWIHGMAMRSEPTMFAGRDQVNPQAGQDCAKDLYAQAGITNPREDFDCAEVYVPFSWYEPMWLENLGFCAEGDGWKLTEAGATAPDGDIPWNPSGGVLSSNPIGASGMVRFGEAAQQVREPRRRLPGRAEDREGARPRLRRRLAVLLDVGRRQQEARVDARKTRSRGDSTLWRCRRAGEPVPTAPRSVVHASSLFPGQLEAAAKWAVNLSLGAVRDREVVDLDVLHADVGAAPHHREVELAGGGHRRIGDGRRPRRGLAGPSTQVLNWIVWPTTRSRTHCLAVLTGEHR